MIRIFPRVKSFRASAAGFVAANDPAEIDRWIGNPGLHIGNQSAPAPGVGRVDGADCRARAGGRGKIAANRCPKVGVEKGMMPGGIAGRRIGALTAGFARVGRALAPILRYFAQRDRGGTTVRFRQVERKAHRRNGRVRGDRSEIELHQPAPQTGSRCPPREKINAVTIAEEAFAILIERVVFLRRQSHYVGRSDAAQKSDQQEARERLVCLHQAEAAK